MAQVAAIDVGSNSVLMLLAEVDAGGVRVLDERGEVTRLGRGLSRGAPLDPDAVRRTLETLADFRARATAAHATIVAVGTEALRRAHDAAAFVEAAGRALGTQLSVIEPAREAALAMRAVTESFPDLAGPPVVLDLGGGSTEIVVGLAGGRGRVARFDSLPLGSVRLHERHLAHDPPTPQEIAALRDDIDRALADASSPPANGETIGVAATVTTLAAVAGLVSPYDGARVHGTRLTAQEVSRQAALYCSCSVADRRAIRGVDPRRADVIPAGALLLERLMAWLGVASIRVSDRGVRWGLVHEFADSLA